MNRLESLFRYFSANNLPAWREIISVVKFRIPDVQIDEAELIRNRLGYLKIPLNPPFRKGGLFKEYPLVPLFFKGGAGGILDLISSEEFHCFLLS